MPRSSLSSGRQDNCPKPVSLSDVPARQRSTVRRVGRFSIQRLRLRRRATGKLPLFTRSRTNILRPLWFAADLPARLEPRYRRCHDRNARFSGPFCPHARNLARAQTRMGKTQREPRPLFEEQHGGPEHLVLNPRAVASDRRSAASPLPCRRTLPKFPAYLNESVARVERERNPRAPQHRGAVPGIAVRLNPGYSSGLPARSRITLLGGKAIEQARTAGALQAFVAAAARRMRGVPGNGRLISA